jgi:hypothetical protein
MTFSTTETAKTDIRHPEKTTGQKAIDLFRRGFDYIEIGYVLHIHEADVEKLIHAEREKARATPRALIGRVPYPGKERFQRPEWGV